jgi:hypothetical protein
VLRVGGSVVRAAFLRMKVREFFHQAGDRVDCIHFFLIETHLGKVHAELFFQKNSERDRIYGLKATAE